MSEDTPTQKMARMLAQNIAQQLPVNPAWFNQSQNEVVDDQGQLHRYGKNEGAEQAYRAQCEKAVFEELVPILDMITASAAPAVPQEQVDQDPQKPTGKSGESLAMTGCRRGWAHREGKKCELCGDTGENVIPGGRYDSPAQQG